MNFIFNRTIRFDLLRIVGKPYLHLDGPNSRRIRTKRVYRQIPQDTQSNPLHRNQGRGEHGHDSNDEKNSGKSDFWYTNARKRVAPLCPLAALLGGRREEEADGKRRNASTGSGNYSGRKTNERGFQ